MLDVHTKEHNYIEIIPPVMVKGKTLEGSGNLPKFSENLYRDIEEDFWWIPTAEVALTGLHSEEILSIDSLPLNYRTTNFSAFGYHAERGTLQTHVC